MARKKAPRVPTQLGHLEPGTIVALEFTYKVMSHPNKKYVTVRSIPGGSVLILPSTHTFKEIL